MQSAPEPRVVVEATETSDGGSDEDPSRGKGVVRLLLAGHFKGVADVRLRINFHEELQAVQAAATGAAVAEKTDALVQAVTEGLEELASSDVLEQAQSAQVQQLGAEFRDTVDALQADGADGILDGIQSAFDTVVAALHELTFPEPAVEQPISVGEEVTTGEEPVQQLTPEVLITAIEDAFAKAFGELADAFTSTRVLPELSPPEGKGGAYARFLGLYEALYGSEDSPGVAEEEGTTDVTV
ncbi:MAG: hypothetical protein PVJ27_08720 [Candidatus Brocadiaceae bacterium]